MSNVYNLQTKLSKEAEKKYRILSEKDKRKISNFSKMILEMLVEDMVIEDESTHRLHIERLSIYNSMLTKNASNISVVIDDMLKKDEIKNKSTTDINKTEILNQSTQEKKCEPKVILNNAFGPK